MACTTILVGKKASYDGSTMIARNDDSGSGHFTAKKFTVVHPEDLPKVYRSVLSHVEVPLPEGAMRFTAMPNAVEGKGIWAASGVNAANVGMTATETITSNPRVLGAVFLLCLICCVNRLCQLITATRIPLFYKIFKTAIDRSTPGCHFPPTRSELRDHGCTR